MGSAISEDIFGCQASTHDDALYWTVELQRICGNEPVGLHLDVPHLIITGIAGSGLALAWNEANITRAIHKYDRIIEVNGLSDPVLIVHELREAHFLEILLGRKQEAEASPLESFACTRKWSSRRSYGEVPPPSRSRARSTSSSSKVSKGSRAYLFSLPQDVTLRIYWALSGGKAKMKDISALIVTSSEHRRNLQDKNPLWFYKMEVLLQLGRCRNSLNVVEVLRGQTETWTAGCSLTSGSIPMTPQKWCMWLQAARQLLQSALTYCDWVALSDIGEILASAKLQTTNAMTLVINILVSWQDPPTAQALMWLWELATGSENPWSSSCPRDPLPEALCLDRLRNWLRENVASAIRPWREQAGCSDNFWDSGPFYDEHWQSDNPGNRVACVAALVLLAAECAYPPISCSLDPCSQGCLISVADLAIGVERVLLCEEHCTDYRKWAARPLALMLLARVRWTLQALPKGESVLHSSRFPDEMRGAMEVQDRAWRGVAIAWDCSHGHHPIVDVNNVEVLHFPDLCSDERWLHTQHGSLYFPQSDTWKAKTVQLDAKFDSQGDCFKGHWLDHETFQPLPARVFSIQARHGGLQRWMNPAPASLPNPTSMCDQLPTNLAHSEAVPWELFGIVGDPADGALRCFHLVPPPCPMPATGDIIQSAPLVP